MEDKEHLAACPHLCVTVTSVRGIGVRARRVALAWGESCGLNGFCFRIASSRNRLFGKKSQATLVELLERKYCFPFTYSITCFSLGIYHHLHYSPVHLEYMFILSLPQYNVLYSTVGKHPHPCCQ